jgi:predicted phosphodiesterase
VRIGVVSDIHGNLVALRAVVTDLQRLGVDRWLSVGDLVGYGPWPNECVETVVELGMRGVAGNHDLIATGELSGERSSSRAQRSHRWTREELRPDVLAHLRALPRRLELDGVVLAHGSLDDPEEYVRTAEQAARQLRELRGLHPAAGVLLLGNTHLQLLYREGSPRADEVRRAPMELGSGAVVVNPGSVGQSRQRERRPRARALLLDMGTREALFRAIDYDLEACLAEVHRRGLPDDAIHAPPRRRVPGRRRAGRLARRLLQR